MTSAAVLGYAQRLYRVALDFAVIGEIEDEIGSINMLHSRLMNGGWTAGELVTVCHILLARAGCSCDYMALGQDMVNCGFEHYRSVVAQLLGEVLVTGEGRQQHAQAD